MASILTVLPYTATSIPAAAASARLVAWRPSGERVQGFVQHLAAGDVFAAAAAELLPDVVRHPSLAAGLVGAALRAALVLAVREASSGLKCELDLAAVIGGTCRLTAWSSAPASSKAGARTPCSPSN